ncbi:MAG: LLM class flavin-dependent oxidoreductase, partial [Dehalococcoidia bacterium]
PPTRVAEEMAMLDGISGGRLVAGFPVGTSMDSNYCYGANPATFRDKYYEAEELIIRAWTEDEMFSFDGKYTQLRYVNLWPKPVQQPHPPVWVPGGGSIETWGWTVDKGYLYAYLSYSGFKRGKQVMDGFWKVVEEKGVEANPYRAGFLQLVCVAGSEAEAEERYGADVEYFYNKMLHVYPGFADAPGYRTLETIKAGLLAQTTQFGREGTAELTWKDIVAAGNVVAGSPDQVTEQLEQVATDLRVGHLMLLNQIGSMSHENAMYNIEKTATEVIPNLRHMWSEYEDQWWPQNAIVREPAATTA